MNRIYYRYRYGKVNRAGVDFLERDWDNLVILDGCRYDAFEQTADFPESLEKVVSRGSNTIQFFQSNICGKRLYDTVYVTSNPQYTGFDESVKFHEVIDLWDDEWNDDLNTVLPENVTERAKEASKEYPNKRLIVHFNQPHVPFIGDTGREQFDLDEITEHRLPFWQQPMAGEWDVSDDSIWEAYIENLEMTLPHVRGLLEALDGKTVVTSDHGNMIGDRSYPVPIKEYGHPNCIYTEELVDVPWLEYTDGERKRIIPEEKEEEDDEDRNVEKHLEYLGYG